MEDVALFKKKNCSGLLCDVKKKEEIGRLGVFSFHRTWLPAVFCFQAPGGIATPLVYGQLLALYLLHNDM